MKKPEQEWRPLYPGSGVEGVELRKLEFGTYLSDRRPGIIVQDLPVEDPACFWIDPQHVYLRVNWSTWGTVSVSSPEQVAALCRTRYCRITAAARNVVSDSSAPVYRIAALPEKLFRVSARDKAASAPCEEESAVSPEKEYARTVRTITEAAQSVSEDLEVLERLSFGEDTGAMLISNEQAALVLEFLPKDRDFIFSLAAPEDEHGVLSDEWGDGVVSLGFLKRLKRMRKFVLGLGANPVVHAGFLADSETLKLLQALADSDLIADIELLSYENLKADLAVLFCPKDS